MRKTGLSSSDLKGIQTSRKVSAILSSVDTMNLKPKSLIGPSKTLNSEGRSASYKEFDLTKPTMKRAIKVANLLTPSSMEVTFKGKAPKQVSKLASIPSYVTTTVPVEDKRVRRAKKDTDDLISEAQGSLLRIAGTARKALARGRVTPERAASFIEGMNTLLDYGAEHNKFTTGIYKQLGFMCGEID